MNLRLVFILVLKRFCVCELEVGGAAVGGEVGAAGGLWGGNEFSRQTAGACMGHRERAHYGLWVVCSELLQEGKLALFNQELAVCSLTKPSKMKNRPRD